MLQLKCNITPGCVLQFRVEYYGPFIKFCLNVKLKCFDKLYMVGQNKVNRHMLFWKASLSDELSRKGIYSLILLRSAWDDSKHEIEARSVYINTLYLQGWKIFPLQSELSLPVLYICLPFEQWTLNRYMFHPFLHLWI